MATINLSLVKSAEQYNAVVNHEIAQYKAGVRIERVTDTEVIFRIGRMSERIHDDALVALATAGREITSHDAVVLARKVERKANEGGLLFAKVTLA